MSHVVTITDVEVLDLDAMKLAAGDCGLTFREGQQTYRWYGHWVGDYPLPVGVQKEDLGKCTHALHLNDRAYEIGLVQQGDKYALMYDFWDGGKGLEKAVGKKCDKLMQRYSYHATIRAAESAGYVKSNEWVQDDGSVKLEFAVASEQQAWAGGGW